MSSKEVTPGAPQADERVVAQLDRIVGSKAFRQSDRLKRFLTFIVNETMAGRGDRLKEFVVGVEVFGKDNGFDPRNDPIVRVEARRLRAQLARYYREEGQSDETLIDLPKGRYAPVFRSAKAGPVRRTLVSALASRNTVAVVPFADCTRAGDQEYLCRGLVQAITQEVCRVPAIRLVVWPRTAPFDREDDLRRVAEEMNVSLAICGSVRASGGTRLIAIHLLDTASGTYLWSESAECGETDEIEVEQQIAAMVAARLRDNVTQAGYARSGVNENLAARNLCVQGRYHLNQRTEESLRKAVEFFEKAIAEDAQYSSAYSGLADTYALLAHYGVISPAEAWTKSASNAAWAVLMNENSPEARTSLAHVKAAQDWDWPGAEAEFRRAIELDPRNAAAHHWYGITCLVPMGRLDEALGEIRTAQDLDPISSIIARDLAFIHYYRRDFEAALEQCDHTIELNPHFAAGYWMLGLVQEQTGDIDEAEAAMQRAVELSPKSPRIRAAQGRLYAISGREKEARAILKQLRTEMHQRYVSPYYLASITIAMGQRDEAFDLLEKALADRSFELTFAHVDPRLVSLHGDPRFAALLERIGVALPS
jgi:serine/threonine-protein kinase